MAVMKGELEAYRQIKRSSFDPVFRQKVRSRIGMLEEDLEKMERQYPEAAQLISD